PSAPPSADGRGRSTLPLEGEGRWGPIGQEDAEGEASLAPTGLRAASPRGGPSATAGRPADGRLRSTGPPRRAGRAVYAPARAWTPAARGGPAARPPARTRCRRGTAAAPGARRAGTPPARWSPPPPPRAAPRPR